MDTKPELIGPEETPVQLDWLHVLCNVAQQRAALAEQERWYNRFGCAPGRD